MNITIITPRFERPSGEPGPIVPPDADFFNDLHLLDDAALREVGMRRWNNPDEEDPDEREDDARRFGAGGTLWLFPGEWFRHIPIGFETVSIMGARERHSLEQDDDIRYGCLAYGIVKGTEPRLGCGADSLATALRLRLGGT